MIMTQIKMIPLLQVAAVVIIIETTLLFHSQTNTNAFTMMPSLPSSSPLSKIITRTTRTTVSSIHLTSLYVKQKSRNADSRNNNNKLEPLFDIIDNSDDDNEIDNNNDLFQIKYNVEDDEDDYESDEYDLDNDDDYYVDDYVDDDLEDNDYIDQGESYTLDYDNDDNNNNEEIENDNHLYQNQQLYYDNIDSTTTNIHMPTKYSRDDDYILTEREDRLFINEKGEKVDFKEKCILVSVEDVSALRKNNRFMQQYNNGDIDIDDDISGSTTSSMNPEEWSVYFTSEESMEEMKDLIRTCGMELVGVVTQRLNQINPKTYIGTGKVKETKELLEDLDSCTVVFDAELTPGQQKHLENAFNKQIIQNDFMGSEQLRQIKVIDRTALILDIFAQHARTREGKLQVDLALHIFRKPRLTKMWTHLERQSGAGGVGLRGPGESQLEIDKRLLRDRIIVLKRKIDAVQSQRDIHRKGRSNLGLPVLALVGYTNAGKSTLLNYLTKAGVIAENILFATLDPTTRRVKLPGLKTHPEVLLTDTVGFIQKLPTQLVAAFRATLEEVREADLLLHIMDVSNPVWHKQEMAVKQVLSEIDAGDKPIVRVLNKIDLLADDDAEELQYEAAMMEDYSVAISSLTGDGMIDLVATIEEALMSMLFQIEVLLPYTHGKEVNMVQEVGHVEEIDYRVEGTYIVARVPEAIANRLKPFYVNQVEQNGQEKGKTNKDDTDWASIGRGRHPKAEM